MNHECDLQSDNFGCLAAKSPNQTFLIGDFMQLFRYSSKFSILHFQQRLKASVAWHDEDFVSRGTNSAGILK